MRFRYQPHNWAEARQMLEPDPGNPSGGGVEPGEQQQRRSSADVLQQYGNDAVRMADRVAQLEGENYRLREARRDRDTRITALETQVQTLTGSQVPQGATVLAGDDAQRYEAYRALGTPDEIRAGLDERQSLSTEVANARRDVILRDVAAAAKIKLPALQRLGADREYEIRDVANAEGQTVRVPHIKVGNDFRPLVEYVRTDPDWAIFAPALFEETPAAAATGTSQGTRPPAQPFPPQRSSATNPPANLAAQFIAQRNEQGAAKKNPLAQ